MRFLWRVGTTTALSAGIAALLMSTTAFAAPSPSPKPPQPPPPSSQPAQLTINYVGVQQSSNGTDGLVIKVSDLIIPSSSTGPYTVNFNLAGANITGRNSRPLGIESKFTESVTYGTPSYQTWFVPLNAPPNTPLSDLSLSRANLNVNEWNYNVKPSQELAVGSLSPLGTLPYGQLPEVPWAAGIPLLALGVGVLVWRRSPQVQRA
ncbi:MAG: hypothetical protein OWU33_09785 [Firmicutes bacterium]|nr:hypothetical protein [Bacillota bacterium]